MFFSLFLDSPILTSFFVYLRFRIRLLIETFHGNPLARVSLPSPEEIKKYKAALGERYPLIHTVGQQRMD
jgi:hypothetical protein